MSQQLNSLKLVSINTCFLRSEPKKIHLYKLIKKHNPHFVLVQ